MLNARSVKNKAHALSETILDQRLDLLFITETWLSDTDSVIINDLVPNGFSFINVPRDGKKGDDVGLVYKSDIKIQTNSWHFTSCEGIDCSIQIENKCVRFLCIYRPPCAKKTDFLRELGAYLSDICVLKDELFITGDLNYHLDNSHNPDTREFISLISAFNLRSHISVATHKAGHSLDAVISRRDSYFTTNYDINDIGISDHFLVRIFLNATKPKNSKTTVTKRTIKDIDLNSFAEDVSNKLIISPELDVKSAVCKYDTTLRHILDAHAPLQTKNVTIRHNKKWFSDQIKKAKVLRRRLERKKQKSGLDADKIAYTNQCRYVNYLVTEAKTEFLKKSVCESKGDIKQLFQVTKKIFTWKPNNALPDGHSPIKLPDTFSEYFVWKIIRINVDILSDIAKTTIAEVNDIICSETVRLNVFKAATNEEIESVLGALSSSTSELDPIPTELIKKCKTSFIGPLTQIVNVSLKSGTVPEQLKEAVIKPLLKKPSLDKNVLKNFRPVSNIAFLSKLVEKVVAKRINHHIDAHRLAEPFQSAYRKYHSTESALLRVHSDIVSALQNKKLCALVLLDLSSAFDTINHAKLLCRLSTRYGITGLALQWLESYLSCRSQKVSMDGFYSKAEPLLTGVPQGSVLGPLLFTLYMAPVGDIMRNHGVNYHFYADDTQIYVFFNVKDASSACSMLEKCICDVKSWMACNFLKLNDEKTEVILIGTKYFKSKLSNIEIKVGDKNIASTSSVNNLGVIFDDTLSMERFVIKKCQCAMFNLRCIANMRKYMDEDITRTLVQAFVISRLDYGNSLLYGVKQSLIKKIQLVQNSAARLVSLSSRYNHITPVLKTLHWLPIEARIIFKILVICFKCLHGEGPEYLSDLLVSYHPTRGLRSSSQCNLVVPRSVSKAGDRAFGVFAPKLWNELPMHLKNVDSILSFRKLLKTRLFRQYY